MSQPEPADDTLGARRVLVRSLFWSAGLVAAVAAGLYAVFWMPYQTPENSKPRTLEILPPPPQVAGAGREAEGIHIPTDEELARVAETLPVRPGGGTEWETRRRKQIPTDAGSGRYPRHRD